MKDDQRGQKMLRDYSGTSFNAMTFRSRAEKLGWTRGSVNDGGGVDAYRKVFPGAGVEAFLGLDGMYVGIGMDESITLRISALSAPRRVKVGGYVYDTPSDEADPRLIPFGEVPPVVFSEVDGRPGQDRRSSRRGFRTKDDEGPQRVRLSPRRSTPGPATAGRHGRRPGARGRPGSDRSALPSAGLQVR